MQQERARLRVIERQKQALTHAADMATRAAEAAAAGDARKQQRRHVVVWVVVVVQSDGEVIIAATNTGDFFKLFCNFDHIQKSFGSSVSALFLTSEFVPAYDHSSI